MVTRRRVDRLQRVSFDEDPFTISIWVMRADGSDARQLTEGAMDVEPVFSPDGNQIAFGRLISDSPAGWLEAIYVMNADGTGLREVVAPRPALEHPDWSPDGHSITFNIGPEHPKCTVLRSDPHGPDKRPRAACAASAHRRTSLLQARVGTGWPPDARRLLRHRSRNRQNLHHSQERETPRDYRGRHQSQLSFLGAPGDVRLSAPLKAAHPVLPLAHTSAPMVLTMTRVKGAS